MSAAPFPRPAHPFSVNANRPRVAALLAWVVLCVLACGTYLMLVLIAGNIGRHFSGWLVPDGMTLMDSARQDMFTPAFELISDYPAAAALAVVNAWVVMLHPMLPALLNVTLLVAIFGTAGRHGLAWPPVLFLLTPYYLAAFLLPSKDIVVAAFFVLISKGVANANGANFWFAILLSALLFYVRDGFAAVLLVSTLLIVATQLLGLAPRLVLIVTTVVASLFWTMFENALADSFLYTRAIGIAAQSDVIDVNSSSSPLGYLLRLVGYATNLAFRPVFSDVTGRVHVLSVFYWISGLTLLYALTCCGRALGSKSLRDRRIGMLGLLSLVLVAITPYVQPRYLLPIVLLIPMFTFTNLRGLSRAMLIIAPVSLVFASLYWLSGNYPPPAEPIPYSLQSTTL